MSTLANQESSPVLDKEKKKKILLGPASTSNEYDAMRPKWDMIQTLLDGTDAMRAAGQTYLPQHIAESDKAYAARLETSTLLNVTSITLDAWVGKPFSEPIEVSEDVPAEIVALFQDFDLQGSDLRTVLRDWLKEGLAKRVSYLLIDYPKPQPRLDGTPRTLADDRNDNLRPYAVLIKPENMLFVHETLVNGHSVVDQARIFEQVTSIDTDGWTEKVVNQVRVLKPGSVEIYQEEWNKQLRRFVYVKTDEWVTDLSFVPLIIFNADREKPPLLDLAYLNVRHWQSTSDQIAVITVARFPMIGVSGALAEDKLKVGPNQWLHIPDPQGKFYYVEHTGKAIAAGRQDLLDLEEVMAEYGAIFLKKRPGGASATARALDTAEVTSPLQDVALRFNACLVQVLDTIAAWLGMTEQDDVGEIKVLTDFTFNDDDMAALQALQGARQLKDISRETYVGALDASGVLGEDFDPAANNKQLEKEQAAALVQMEAEAKIQAKTKPKAAQPNPVGTTQPNANPKPTPGGGPPSEKGTGLG